MEADQVTELSASARVFLLNLAQIAHNESERPIQPQEDSDSSSSSSEAEGNGGSGGGAGDGRLLTWDALKLILSVLSADTEYPWNDPPSFKVRNFDFSDCILNFFLFII